VAYIPIPSYEHMRRRVQKLEKEALRRKQADEVLRRSEERYRMIFNYSPRGIVHFDSDGTVVDCNECFLEIVGAPKEKLVGFNMTESLRDEGMRSAVVAGLSGKPNYFEGDYRSVTGNKVTPVRAMFSRITTEDGRFLGAVGLLEDISERKKSEAALGELREYLRKIANSISDPIFVKDRQHRHVLVNDALCTLAGRERKDLIGRTDYDFFPKEQVDIFWEKDEIVFQTGEENENEEEITDARGSTRTIVTKKTLYTDKAGDKFIVGVIRDITERKEAELALQAAHRELKDIIEFLPDATLVIGTDKKVLYWNRAMEDMTGLKKSDILGTGEYSYAVPFYGCKRPMLIDLVMSKQPDIEKQYDFVKRIGNTVYGEAYVPGAYRGKGAYLWSTAAPLLAKDGSITGYIQSIRDISDRKHAEEALRQSEEKYRQLFETVADAILVFDSETRRFIDVNEKACCLYGYSREEFLKLTHTDITAEPDSSNTSIEETLAGTRTQVPLRYHRKKEGTLFPAEISSSTFVLAGRKVLCGVVRDITECKRVEEELSAKTRRLEEFNAALKVLLKQREEDRTELEESILLNVKSLIVPYVEKLKKSRLGGDQMTYLTILESHMRKITSPFTKRLSEKYLGLTPVEVQAAGLIKEGKTTKEIAESLGVAENTVSSNRFHIRKKLGLTNKKVNLRYYLKSLEK
jgi:PAS domain S-box-containing protein